MTKLTLPVNSDIMNKLKRTFHRKNHEEWPRNGSQIHWPLIR